jgi:hypothetical protein
MAFVSHEHWLDSLFGKEGSFFELHNACSIAGTALSEDKEW